ncbi:hypothetical protein [Marinimicrobium sp. ABcell2]|uniref:hypothetical protein n=1 Tax=Marinimicrobium sp. ABcell2 TaxID=3069751 RepID=UPI0027B328E4|nr:hypothetical protein [Marinimicrobium sp. ABcell2]MDQ2076637.1 hypothetical protein [Marinimicrobium sp. ABcell2]
MTERTEKVVIGAQLLLLVLPVTLFMLALVGLSYVAYPIPNPAPIQILFDVWVVLSVLGVVSAWRLGVGYLKTGAAGLAAKGLPWLILLSVTALIGLISLVIAIEQLVLGAGQVPEDRVGFTLLAPTVALLPLAIHLSVRRVRGKAK